MAYSPEELSHRLAPGTQVGEWRVVAWQGQGAYGAVYRAVSVSQEHQGPVALKLSLYPWDARLVREAELLARLSHPSIPRLFGRGQLCGSSGAKHPFLVMEWVDGTPLYDWAQQRALTGQRTCQLLAELARALETVHAAGAVHRDVKGDNVLVRHSDGRALLLDFGSGHFQGATRLTWQSLPPGTFAYQSAQACHRQPPRRHRRPLHLLRALESARSPWQECSPGIPGSLWWQRAWPRCCCGPGSPRLGNCPRARRKPRGSSRRTRALPQWEILRPPLPRLPPSRPRSQSPSPRSRCPNPVPDRPGRTRRAGARAASRCPSTAVAGWRTPR
jgi:predicted Ser/Thr protein kinase